MKTNGWAMLALAGLAALFAAGCEEEYDGPWVPDLSGQWKGSYYFLQYDKTAAGPDSAPAPAEAGKASKRGERDITAVIAFDEENHTRVTITTSLQGRAHFLYGNLDASGNMVLTDQYDGETWTTHRRRATPDLIEINDLVFEGGGHSGTALGLRTIRLDEHLLAQQAEESVSYFDP
ncbi:MAG: hypothetical protein FJ225_00865 [Lentisphaerae bacterium]|nr:hypothetical protein [Lentisphaerota bacterium]